MLFEGSGSHLGLVVLKGPSPIIPVTHDALNNVDRCRYNAIVYRFNILWPHLVDMHSWISTEWIPLLIEEVLVYQCAKGFFIVVFTYTEDKDHIFSLGP